MLVDCHVHIADSVDPVWRVAKFTAEDMLQHMDGPGRVFGVDRRIDMAAAMPGMGFTATSDLSFEEQHRTVINAVAKYPDRFVGTFILNPRLGLQAGIDTLRKLVKGGGFRMVKLNPAMHNWWPNKTDDLIYPILEEAITLDIPVLVHMGEPPYAVPNLCAPMIRDHPKATIILAHFGTQGISYAGDAINVAKQYPNVLLETGWGHTPRINEAARALGADRLVFGSDSPPLDLWSQLRLVEALTMQPPLGIGMSESDAEKIMGGTMTRLLKLGATRAFKAPPAAVALS
jgi:predicted TIM-barrel fold metal-dependent hydrolase